MADHGTRARYTKGKCRCDDCCEANREYFREYYRIARTPRGILPDVEPSRVIAHIEWLRTQGVGCVEIAKAAGVRKETVLAVSRRIRGVRPSTAERILAVRPLSFRVGITGSQRRLRALAALGWSGDEMAQRGGLDARLIRSVMNAEHDQMYRHHADAIARLYDTLSMALGPSAEARRRAAVKGWPPPLAWDDDTLDDPDAQPHGIPDRTRRGVDLDDWLWIVRGGEQPARAAERMGITLNAVENAARRNGREDVLDVMATRARKEAA